MPWRSPSRLRSEPSAAARQAPLAGGRLLTVMMLRGYYRPLAVSQRTDQKGDTRYLHPVCLALLYAVGFAVLLSKVSRISITIIPLINCLFGLLMSDVRY